MTPDFDRLAREILGSSKFHDRGGVPAIATALRSVWQQGINHAAEFYVDTVAALGEAQDLLDELASKTDDARLTELRKKLAALATS